MRGTSTQLDLSYLEEMTGGDQEFIEELLETYLETAPDLLEAIGAAAKSRDQDKAVYASHTLKGSSRSIGAEPLGELCQALEVAARDGDLETFARLVPAVTAGFELLVREIGSGLRHAA